MVAGAVETQVLIVGGGATGTAVARDLALRGVACVLVERADLNAGASGRNHGLLHSGARYVSNDLAAAIECREEGAILKRLAPQCIQDTGGLFIAVEGDDEHHVAAFPEMCARAGIPARAVPLAEARALEPALSERAIAVYAVPDASIDPFMLSLDSMAQAERLGARLLRRTALVALEREGERIVAARLRSTVTGAELRVEPQLVINAAGAWARQIAALAGAGVPMVYSKGTLVITHARLAQRVINRLRRPSNADIVMPGGTVSIVGTTSITVDDLEEIQPTTEEVDLIVEEAAAMLPLLRETRLVRAYAGVRPLISAAATAAGDARAVSRGFALIDHAQDRIANLITITGGKLTTCRLMAERTTDLACRRLGVSAACRTREEPLPADPGGAWTEPALGPRAWMRRHGPSDVLLCECEMVSRTTVDALVTELRPATGAADPGRERAELCVAPGSLLADLALRSRLGKGACQGGFCTIRTVAHLYDRGAYAGARGLEESLEFLRERWRGVRPVLWGDQLAQAELAEAIHCGLHGSELLGRSAAGQASEVPPAAPGEVPAPPAPAVLGPDGTRSGGQTGEPAVASAVSASASPRRAPEAAPAVHDVAVVGAGLAGMAAAVFAGNRGLRTVQIGNAGALLFSSGLLDLMGVHPLDEGRHWSDPWAAVAAVAREPRHPYARVAPAELRAGFDEVLAALAEAGLVYAPPGERNQELLTSAGTVKSTYAVPRSMLAGVSALAARTPCLLVDFEGLREHSAAAIAAVAGSRWPGLRTLRLDPRALQDDPERARSGAPSPATGQRAGEVCAAHLARALELEAGRAALAALIRPQLGGARAVGLPAVLGLRRTEEIAAELERRLEAPVFEIPGMPPSVPGLRLKEAFERAVTSRGVRRLVQQRVVAVVPEADAFTLYLEGAAPGGAPLRARAVVLATGRFMGRGLLADRAQVREALLDLPVYQPPTRAEWHRADFFDPAGHPVNQAGVEVDEAFRPRDALGRPQHALLFAIGTMLAHHDWARAKCGAGVAIASARVAVDAARAALAGSRTSAERGRRGSGAAERAR